MEYNLDIGTNISYKIKNNSNINKVSFEYNGEIFDNDYLPDANSNILDRSINIFEINDLHDFKNHLIVVDNFYEDPYKIREYALNSVNYAINYAYGYRTISTYTNDEIQMNISKYLQPYIKSSGCSEKLFANVEPLDCNVLSVESSGSFLFNVLKKHGKWIHADNVNWAAVIYLTPNAPVDWGTSNFIYKNGNVLQTQYCNNDTKNITRWRILNNTGYIFNKLVIYNARNYHGIQQTSSNTTYKNSCFVSNQSVGNNEKNNYRISQTFFINSFD